MILRFSGNATCRSLMASNLGAAVRAEATTVTLYSCGHLRTPIRARRSPVPGCNLAAPSAAKLAGGKRSLLGVGASRVGIGRGMWAVGQSIKLAIMSCARRSATHTASGQESSVPPALGLLFFGAGDGPGTFMSHQQRHLLWK